MGDPTVGGAIREIKEQLNALGGQGPVWIDGWKEKYGALGTLREFLDSRPDKFQVVPLVGNKFFVALASGGGGWNGSWQVSPKNLQGKGTGKGTSKNSVSKAPMPALMNGKAKAKAKTKAKAASPAPAKSSTPASDIWYSEKSTPVSAKPAAKSMANSEGAKLAIREIKQQLMDPANIEGKVWIENWKQRFGLLGTLQEFLLSRPDVFFLAWESNTKFSVGLVQQFKQVMQGGWQGNAGGNKKRKAESSVGPAKKVTKGGPADEAIKEIVAQLKNPKSMGKVWVRSWGTRFAESLGSLREFLESHPDKFLLVVDEADPNKFTVELV